MEEEVVWEQWAQEQEQGEQWEGEQEEAGEGGDPRAHLGLKGGGSPDGLQVEV